MMVVFEFVFDLFDRVMQGRIKEYSIGFQEGEHKAVLCKLGESKCKCVLFSRECWSRFRGRFDEKSGSIMQPVREED